MELLFLLLPIAAFSGWFVGRRKSTSRKVNPGCPPLSHDFLQGLNFLLNEQQDKALEVFIRMSEADNETVDIQFALASLFLRRGEVDRAIRIHQNLIARPMLPRQQRHQALYELGRDYMRAGLLDRAESLFQELVNDSKYAKYAQRQLLDIFQQEKEWQKAVDVAHRLSPEEGEDLGPVIAHYYCEQAEELLKKGETGQVTKLLKRALGEDRNCVRASILEAEVAMQNGQLKSALKAYMKIEQQDPDYLPVVIEPLRRGYEQQGNDKAFIDYLRKLLERHESPALVRALAQQMYLRGEEKEAVSLLKSHLQRRPSLRALEQLLSLRSNGSLDVDKSDSILIRGVVEKMLEAKPVFQCNHCGFSSKALHWQCPSCKRWNKVKPIHGIEG